MKKIWALLALCTLAHAAGTVSQQFSQIGTSGTYAVTFTWTGDASTGTVPATAAALQGVVQGYRIISAETSPGSPAPTNNYTVTLTDFSGVDLLGGGGGGQSATSGASIAASPSAPPIFGTFNLNVTGNSVGGAKGTVIVYLSPLSQVYGLTPTAPSFASQGPNLVYASPNGASGAPNFRGLVGADVPQINLAASGAGGVGGTLPGANMSQVNLAASGNGGVGGITPAANGGTGVASPAAHGVMVAEGASPATPVTPGASGTVLTSNGPSADPSYQAISAGGSGYLLVTTYNWTQSPAGSLTGSVLATVNLSPCPQGVAGTDANHYLYVAGTGTPEAVLISGGTCTSGAGSGTVQFTPANNHSAGYSLATATGGLQECLNVGQATALPFACVVTANINEYADVTAPGISNWEILGIGKPVISMYGGGTRKGINIPGPAQTGTTTNVTMSYGSFATRQNTFTPSFVVSAATNIAANGYLLMYWDGQALDFSGGQHTYVFRQVVKVNSVVGTTITPFETVKIPLAAATFTGSPGVTVLTMAQNVKLSGLIFDGTNLTGGGNQACIWYDYLVNSTFSDIVCRNVAQYGLLGNFGYRNIFSNLMFSATDSNTSGGGLMLNYESNSVVNNVTAANSPFAVNLIDNTELAISNVSVSGNTGARDFKLANCVWCTVANVNAADSASGSSAFSVQEGSYRNVVTNLACPNGGTNGGLHFAGQQNQYNIVHNAQCVGQATYDVEIAATDNHNAMYGTFGTFLDNGTDNEIIQEYRERITATNSAGQSIPNASTTALSWDTNGNPNTGGLHSTSSNPTRFTPTAFGYFRGTCTAEFASNSTGYRQVIWEKNGVAVVIVTVAAVNGTNTDAQASLPPTVMNGTSDYLECWVFQNSGGALVVSNSNSAAAVERAY